MSPGRPREQASDFWVICVMKRDSADSGINGPVCVGENGALVLCPVVLELSKPDRARKLISFPRPGLLTGGIRGWRGGPTEQ